VAIEDLNYEARPSRRKWRLWTPARTRLLLITLIALVAMLPGLRYPTKPTSFEERVIGPAQVMASSVDTGFKALTPAALEIAQVDGDVVLNGVPGTDLSLTNPWIIPLVDQGQPRLQKPPLPYWCAAGWMMLFTQLNGRGWFAAYDLYAVRLTPILCGAAGVLLIARLGRRLLGPFGGLCAALVWAGSLTALSEYRRGMADPLVAAATLAAVLAWVELAVLSPNARRWRRRAWAVVLFTSIALGLLAKGPVMLLFLALFAIALFVARRHFARLPWWAWLIGLPLAALPLTAWAWAVLQQIPQAWELWRYQSVGQLTDNVYKRGPWWYYLANLPIIAAPWVALFFVGLVMAFRKRSRGWSLGRWRASSTAALWLGLSVVVMSCMTMKKNAYLLPLMPTFALLCAAALRDGRALLRISPHKARASKAVLLIQWIIGAVLAGLILVRTVVVMLEAPLNVRREMWAALAWSGAAAVVIAMIAIACKWRSRYERQIAYMCAAFAVLLGTYLNLFEFIIDRAWRR